MAFEKILEFGEGNRYKVKFEVANIDTSTVDDVELDEEIASLEKVSETDYAFNVREYYSAEGEHEVDVWEDDYRGGDYNGGSLFRENRGSWSCDYSVDRFWSIGLDNGELLVGNDGDYEEMEFDNERFPEGLDVYDVKDDFETDAKYDVLITYEKLEDEGKKANSITLNCSDIAHYGIGVDVPDVELSDADLEKLAEWYVKHYGNGSATVEGVKAHEYDNEIKKIIEHAILENATVYDEKAREYFNETEKDFYVAYSAKVNCSFELNGMTFNINYDEIERKFSSRDSMLLKDYSKVVELIEKTELDNLFPETYQYELERLKTEIKNHYYSVTSVPVEVDWEMCKGYAKEVGVSDEYLTEANLNRALELALEDIASAYSRKGCFVFVKDNLIHVGTNIADYEDTAEEDIKTIEKLTLEKDDLGILRLYVSGEIQNELSKASDYKKVINRISSFIEWFVIEREQADTFIQEINVKIKNILPSVMERILNVVKVDENREWLNKKLEYAVELEQAVETYLKAKGEVKNLLEDRVQQKLKLDIADIILFLNDDFDLNKLRRTVRDLKEPLAELQVGKSSFSMLQVAEIKFEEALKMESGSCSLVLNEIRSSLEKLLSEHSDNEKMAQEIEEALALTKQPKVITAEEEMVSAWNKYISLKMEK